jgi:hypothetical protein
MLHDWKMVNISDVFRELLEAEFYYQDKRLSTI